MFNGIIFNTGKITKILKSKLGKNIFIFSNLKLTKKNLGISVACDGVCLTLISHKNQVSEFYLSNETLKRSKFKNCKIGDKLNVELPLKFGDRISGHICQGHVDTTGILIKSIKKEKSTIFEFKVKRIFRKYFIDKASILINGVSLTISNTTNEGFKVWVIPHTLKLTNLSQIKKNDLVNIEIDILSKYIKKHFNEKR